MNSLSWLMYLAEVAGNFRLVAAVGLIGTVAFFGFATLGLVVSEGEIWGWYSRHFARMVGSMMLAAMIVTVMPTQTTIYMIAASELGEQAVRTPEAKELLGDVKDIITQQLKKLKQESK
jgi:hypothetical protein